MGNEGGDIRTAVKAPDLMNKQVDMPNVSIENLGATFGQPNPDAAAVVLVGLTSNGGFVDLPGM